MKYQFPARVNKNFEIHIPKNIRERILVNHDLRTGTNIDVWIEVVPTDEKERLRHNLEAGFKGGD